MTVPVRIVPLPLILKQWSASIINFLSISLFGIESYLSSTLFKSLEYFYVSYFAEYGTMITFYPNFVLLNIFLSAFIFGAKSFYSRQSTLFKTTIKFFMNN